MKRRIKPSVLHVTCRYSMLHLKLMAMTAIRVPNVKILFV